MGIDKLSLYAELKKQATVKPERRSTDFKLKFGRTTTDQTSRRIVAKTRTQENHEAEFLIHALEASDMLRDLCQNQIVFLVLSSSTYQNLFKKISGLLKESMVPE